MTRQLRVPRHRGTTAHLCSAYPFLAEAGLGHRGVYLGTNLLTGGGGFAFDPFEAYQAGLVTNPNLLVAGEPGTGKSSFVKTYLARAHAVFGAATPSTARARAARRGVGGASRSLDSPPVGRAGSTRSTPDGRGAASGATSASADAPTSSPRCSA